MLANYHKLTRLPVISQLSTIYTFAFQVVQVFVIHADLILRVKLVGRLVRNGTNHVDGFQTISLCGDRNLGTCIEKFPA